MRVITSNPGSGTLGGVIGTHGRSGYSLSARSASTGSASKAKTNALAVVSALATQWRTLSASQQTGWAALASSSQTGYLLYISCNRNRSTLGLSPISEAPAARPALPALTGAVIVPFYSAATPPRSLRAWQIVTEPPLDGTYGLVARLTQSLSKAKANIRASDLRIVAAGQQTITPAFVPYSSWSNRWGDGPLEGLVTCELNLVDLPTGFAGTAVRASAVYSASSVPASSNWSTVLDQNGNEIAVLPNQIINIDGTVVAGP